MGAYKVLFIGGLVFAILFLIATIVLFFLLKIPKVFGILTGRAQKKALEDIRNAGQAKIAQSQERGNQAIKAHEASVENVQESTELGREKEEVRQPEVKKVEEPVPSYEEQSRDAGRPVGTRPGRDYTKSYEETEVLGAEDFNMDGGTEILTAEEQQRSYASDDGDGTDVLSEGKAKSAYDRIRSAMRYDSRNSANLDYEDDDESETDVLKASAAFAGFAGAAAAHEYAATTAEVHPLGGAREVVEDVDSIHASETEDDYHVLGDDAETAVLRSGTGTYSGATSVTGTDGTAVLSESNDSGKIYGYNGAKVPEEVMKPKEKPGITYLYSKTVVHTEESL